MKKISLFESTLTHSGQNILAKDGSAYYHPEVISAVDCAKLMNHLINSFQWEADQLLMFGKPVITRRKVAWVADHDCTYTYSGIKKQPQAWTSELLVIKLLLEKLTHSEFNSCLLNFYHDGADGMGWHSDNETELDALSPIASLSLGATRKFAFKHKQDKSTISLFLENGSALIMYAPTQQFWQHALPKTRTVHTPRINLTFRSIIPNHE